MVNFNKNKVDDYKIIKDLLYSKDKVWTRKKNKEINDLFIEISDKIEDKFEKNFLESKYILDSYPTDSEKYIKALDDKYDIIDSRNLDNYYFDKHLSDFNNFDFISKKDLRGIKPSSCGMNDELLDKIYENNERFYEISGERKPEDLDKKEEVLKDNLNKGVERLQKRDNLKKKKQEKVFDKKIEKVNKKLRFSQNYSENDDKSFGLEF